MTLCIGEMLGLHSQQLQAALELDPGSARIEVQCLLQAVLRVNRAHLLAHPEQVLEPEPLARYTALLERRLRGEPVAYLLGEREFYGLTFNVSAATLIPRPETELLVELALERIPLSPDGTTSHSTMPASGQVAGYLAQAGEGGRQAARGQRVRVLDLGTGSGAIALSIAHARPDAGVVAVDMSAAALEIAQSNLRRLALGNVRLLQSDWFSALQGERFDLIVSNPPYIAAGDQHLLRGDVRFEPRSALASGADGLEDIRRIIVQARGHLDVDGWLLLEHGYDQAERVRELLQQAGYDRVFSARDLAGIERVSGGTSPGTAA